MNRDFEKEYAAAAMKWYGWGSPVGLSIFFISLCICALLIRKVILG